LNENRENDGSWRLLRGDQGWKKPYFFEANGFWSVKNHGYLWFFMVI
jgi:hypothetical protein